MTAKELRKADLREIANELQWANGLQNEAIQAVLVNLCEQVAKLQEQQHPLRMIAFARGEGELI